MYCGVFKENEEFSERTPSVCKDCRRDHKRASTSKRIGRPIKANKRWQGEYRECSDCGILKHRDEYSIVPTPEGRRIPNAACKECIKERQRKSIRNPITKAAIRRSQKTSYENGGKDRSADWRLRREYGLTLEDKNRLVKESKDTCPLCKTINPSIWVVDHCHQTGKVRGVICGLCNSMLGMSKDRVDTLLAGARYLLDTGRGAETEILCTEGVPKPEEEWYYEDQLEEEVE